MSPLSKFGVKTSIPLEKKLKNFVVGNFTIFTVLFVGVWKNSKKTRTFSRWFFQGFLFAFLEGFSTFHSEASPTLVALGYDRRPPGASPRVPPVWLRRFRAGGKFFLYKKILQKSWNWDFLSLKLVFSVKSLGVFLAESPIVHQTHSKSQLFWWDFGVEQVGFVKKSSADKTATVFTSSSILLHVRINKPLLNGDCTEPS